LELSKPTKNSNQIKELNSQYALKKNSLTETKIEKSSDIIYYIKFKNKENNKRVTHKDLVFHA